MSRFIKNDISRDQFSFLPLALDDMVADNSIARVIFAFTDSLLLDKLGFKRTSPNSQGAPSYDPKDLLNLYIYGYNKKIRSSRKLEEATHINIEVMWLINNLHPDHNTISDFRKDNHLVLKNIFREFNKLCIQLNLFSKSSNAHDGSKFRAVNAKDKNFTPAKLDDRIKRANKSVDKYMNDLDKFDKKDDRFIVISQKIDALKDKINKYTAILNTMEQNNDSQVSLTDKDSRLMLNNSGGFDVSFNVQTSVDKDNDLIADFVVTNQVNDNGLITSLSKDVKDMYECDILEVLVDGGYVEEADINNALNEKIVPILPENDKGYYELQRDYIPADIDEETKKGSSVEDVKKCLDAGVLPDCYSYLDMEVKVVNKKEYVYPQAEALSLDKMAEMVGEGFFVRDIKKDKVICPGGKTLRRKSTTSDGKIRYYSSTACTNCPINCSKTKPL